MFVKPEHEGRISHVNTASVRTGLGNTLGRVTFMIFYDIMAGSGQVQRVFVSLQGTREP